jgi:DNA-binding transcriptional MerR regulator
MAETIRIGEVARRLEVSAQHLRILEWNGRIPPARRALCGRFYTPFDIELLRNMGVGRRPRRLKSPEEVLEGMS